MVFDLRIHGFANCVVASDLTDISHNLPTWNTIPRTTIKVSHGKTIEHFIAPLIDASGVSFLPSYEWQKKVDSGTYGEIYLANRKKYYRENTDISGVIQFRGSASDTGELIAIKKTPIVLSSEEEKMSFSVRQNIINEEILAHIYEAAVLTLAYSAVKAAGLEHAVPRVYEIFCHTETPCTKITDVKDVCISMEYILGDTLLRFMRENFKRTTDGTNDKIFLHFVSQIATILEILQSKLRMNHRDIKINNVLLRDKTSAMPLIVLIDYGFACIANGVQEPDAEMSKIEAGSYFGSRYACFKKGRDMCQFLYSLHCYFPFDEYLSPAVLALVKPWMLVNYKYGEANLLNGLRPNGHHSEERLRNLIFDEGIYILLRRPEVDPLQCAPENILKDINSFLKIV
jgi:serine/threonine protein kinase